jgi:hypothetical protein
MINAAWFGRTRSNHASTSPDSATRTWASWKGRKSPSKITASPRAKRITWTSWSPTPGLALTRCRGASSGSGQAAFPSLAPIHGSGQRNGKTSASAMGRIAAVKKPAPRPITINASTGWRAMMRSSAAINPSGVTEPGEPKLVEHRALVDANPTRQPRKSDIRLWATLLKAPGGPSAARRYPLNTLLPSSLCEPAAATPPNAMPRASACSRPGAERIPPACVTPRLLGPVALALGSVTQMSDSARDRHPHAEHRGSAPPLHS